MTAIFVSHRSSDNTEAQSLKEWLAGQGHERLFLDFDPADGIPAGVDWEQRLYQELRRCQALLIVLTPAWLESKWCSNELAIAREKGKAVFIVRVKPCASGPVIPAIQEVDITADRDAALAKLARGLKEHGLDPRDSFDWKPGRPIYPGLAAFDVDDAAIFFGRSEESWQVVEMLRRMRLQATGSPKLLLITGASGSGKSSLMRAGVLARLRKEPASWIVTKPFRRTTDALGALVEALAWAFPRDQRPTSLEAITGRLEGEDGATQLLTLARELRLALDRPDATLVLALDQAEELLAVERAADAARLLDLFQATLASVGNEVLVLATIRSDRLAGWQQHASIKATAEHGELPFEMLPLAPMPMARVGEIVRGPAVYEGLRIDDDLVDAIRADTATPDALPLLAYTLQYLHRNFASDGRLTLADYRSFGGLEGSVRSQADAAIPIDKLGEDDRRALQEAFVPGLVRATTEGGFSRSRALFSTLPLRVEPYFRRLTDDARLLLMDSDPRGGVTVEIAHDALLRVWPTLARWIAEDAANLRRLEALQRAAADWAQSGHRKDFLVHRDHRLADAETLVAQGRFGARLDDSDRDYLAAGRQAQNERERLEKEESEQKLRAAQQLAEEQKAKTQRTKVGLITALVLAIIAGWSWYRAEKQREVAQYQLERANSALASGLWNDLDFAEKETLAPPELNALWALATNDGPVRASFEAELSAETDRIYRFARRPEPVARALGLDWPSPQAAQATLHRVLAAITETSDPGQLSGLARAAKTVAGNLGAEAAQAVVASTIAALETSPDPRKLWPLAQVIQSLPVRLGLAQTEAVLKPILREIDRAIGPSRRPVEPGTVQALAHAVQAVSENLTVEQVRDALIRVLKLMAGSMAGPNSPDELRTLAEAVQALPAPLDEDQVQAALGPILEAIEGTSDPDQLRALAQAVQALARKLTTEQAQAALGPVLAAIEGTDDPWALGALAEVMHALSAPLTDAQARNAISKLLRTIADTTDEGSAWGLALAEAVRALPAKLTTDQKRDLLGPVLDAIKSTTDYGQAAALTATAQTLAGELDAEQIQEALGPVLDALKGTIEYDQFLVLTWAAKALTQALGDELVRDASAPILTVLARTQEHSKLQTLAQALGVHLAAEQIVNALATTEDTIDADQLQVFAQAVKAESGQLPTQLSGDALGLLLDAISRATPVVNHRSDSWKLWLLAEAMRVLSVQLTSEQAREALTPVLTALSRQTGSHTPTLAKAVVVLPVELTAQQAGDALASLLNAMEYATELDFKVLAQGVQVLIGKFTGEQAHDAIVPLLDTIGGTPTATHEVNRFASELLTALHTLSKKITAEQARAAVAGVSLRLALAPTQDEAAGWAEVLSALLPREKSETYLALVVEALKCPTSAGPATDVLVEALQQIDPNAPGKQAGLNATLSWLRKAYPAIDLEARPRCPDPSAAQTDLACPDGGN